jgi:glycyl-tRNA synthetase
MNTLHATNGLVFWTEEEIKMRKLIEDFLVLKLTEVVKTQNRGFEFVQVEAPVLTPRHVINQQYSDDDIYVVADGLALRPETTLGSFLAAKELLDPYRTRKFRLPLVVWQHGKSFRREQDQPSKHMRLKEFYQLEFQIMYSRDTKNDYGKTIVPAVNTMIQTMIGLCHTEPSDRLPSYSEETIDVICDATNMEVCSISKRTDFDAATVLEVAVGTDRCVYNMMKGE